MPSRAATVAEYLAELPPERRAVLEAVRKVIRANLDRDYEEGMGYGMIGYFVPHRVFPAGYHCDPKQPLVFAGLGAQKNYMALYLMSAYGDPAEAKFVRAGFAAAKKKLDMGKSCIRFRRLEDLPLDVIGAAIRRVPARAYVARYVQTLEERGKAGSKRAAAAAARAKTGAPKTESAKVAPARARTTKASRKA